MVPIKYLFKDWSIDVVDSPVGCKEEFERMIDRGGT